MSILAKPYFHDEAAAFAHVEAALWPEGPVCPACGSVDNSYALHGMRSRPTKKSPEGVRRYGLKKCADCGKQYTVRVGTIFESSHIELHKWLQAIHLMTSSKKGISAHQLHRILEVTYKSAWFLAHRIREAMRSGDLAPMGGAGGVVEVDETYIGKQDGISHDDHSHLPGGQSAAFKNVVLTLVERGGSARSFHIDNASVASIAPLVNANIDREANLMTDEGRWYQNMGKPFASHERVNHSKKEYARGSVSTNTVEGFYSIFKRGMKGIYQHCSEKHLHRYLAEFDFRYSNRCALGIEDQERATVALVGAQGKRLMYRATV